MNTNLIFLQESDLDTPIYRIMKFSTLKRIFFEKKLTLVKPKIWDDPFENFILNSTGRLSDGSEFEITFRDNYYGQCWSLVKESDAMWRIYSPCSTKNKIKEYDGVKVKTTIRKLFTPLYNMNIDRIANGETYTFYSFIGRVQYKSTKDLINMLNDKEKMSNKIFDTTGWGQASSFFLKRKAFSHEKEIRIIHKCNYENNGSDIFQFNINPIDIFDEIVFDPRMSTEKYKKSKKELRNLEYKKKIIQSGLYKIRKFTIELERQPIIN